MVDKTIPALTDATLPLTGTETIHVVQGGNSREVALSNIAALVTGAMLKGTYDPNDDGIISVANGGTNAATASGARINLGLGTMAVQDAASVSITGGTITGVSFPWSSVTTTPTTLSGYGITDGQPLNAGLTAISALSTQAYGRALLTHANEASFKAGVNLEPGVDVQAYSALLSSVSGLALAAGDIIYGTGSNAVARLPIAPEGNVLKVGAGGLPEWGTVAGTGDMLSTNNLSDLASAATARRNLDVAKILTAENYGAVGDGVTDDTDALVSMFTDMQTLGLPGMIAQGDYLVREGELVWTITGTTPDSPGPTLYTAGKVMLIAAGNADAPLMSIHNNAATGDGGFISGGYVGPLWFDDTTVDVAPNRHGLMLHGVQGMEFGFMQSDNLKGDLIHLKSVGTALTADQWHVNNCKFAGCRAWTIDGWAFNNDTVSQVFNFSEVGLIWALGGGKGALKSGGAGNSFKSISSGWCLGWAVDLTPSEGTTQRCHIGSLELDAPEYGLRVDGLQNWEVRRCRITHREGDFLPIPPGVIWPIQALCFGGPGAGTSTSDGYLEVQHRLGASITSLNYTNLDFGTYNSDATVARVTVDHTIAQTTGGFTVPDSAFCTDLPPSALSGVLVTNGGKIVHDARTKNVTRARMTGAVAIVNTGYQSTPVLFGSETVDEGANYDPATGRYTVPARGLYEIRGQISISGLAAGNLVRVAVMRTILSTSGNQVLGETHSYAVGAGAQTYSAQSAQLCERGDTLWFSATTAAASVNTAALTGGFEAGNNLIITPVGR